MLNFNFYDATKPVSEEGQTMTEQAILVFLRPARQNKEDCAVERIGGDAARHRSRCWL